MKTISDIRVILSSHAKELLLNYGITKLSLFGSVARGEANDKSDVDLLATFNQPVGLLKLIGAEQFLSDLLEIKVDLIPSDEIRHELQDQILKESIPL